jgi:hypothetical protein
VISKYSKETGVKGVELKVDQALQGVLEQLKELKKNISTSQEELKRT